VDRNTEHWGLRLDASLENLDAGEEDAIALALEIHADLILMDDREGVLAARRNG
jgi:predicted nucleic acid-binding protein